MLHATDSVRLMESEQHRRAAETLARWRIDPCTMVREEFSERNKYGEITKEVVPDGFQADVLRRFARTKRTALKASKGVGKSALLSWIAINFLATRPYPKIAVTSITKDNLRDGLWAEIGKWLKRSQYLKSQFEYQKNRVVLKADPDNWFISARTWAKDANPDQLEDTLAGLHADYILMLCDEVGGYPEAVLAAAEGALASGIECHLVIAGNPTHTEGPLWNACKFQRDMWDVVEINADPLNPNRSSRVSKQWAVEQGRKYGTKSPFYLVNVKGEFPMSTTDALVAMDNVINAYGRTHAYRKTPTGYDHDLTKPGPELQIGAPKLSLDVARRGSNRNVLTLREGDFVRWQIEWFGEDLVYTAGKAAEYFKQTKAEVIFVDDIGVGGGVVDILIDRGLHVIPVNVSMPALDSDNHVNLRSELAGIVQERFLSGRISLPEEMQQENVAEGLATQLTTLRMKFDSRGRRKLEDKDSYKARTSTSPDHLDSLMISFADEGYGTAEGSCSEEQELQRGSMGVGFRSEPRCAPQAGELVIRRQRMRLRD